VLSDKQKVWIDFLRRSDIPVELCRVGCKYFSNKASLEFDKFMFIKVLLPSSWTSAMGRLLPLLMLHQALPLQVHNGSLVNMPIQGD
jgi:hypothetical protein